jgi:hypothetical protein
MAPILYPNSCVQAIGGIRAMLGQAPIESIVDETKREHLMEVNALFRIPVFNGGKCIV